jgi:hypothetical protein
LSFTALSLVLWEYLTSTAALWNAVKSTLPSLGALPTPPHGPYATTSTPSSQMPAELPLSHSTPSVYSSVCSASRKPSHLTEKWSWGIARPFPAHLLSSNVVVRGSSAFPVAPLHTIPGSALLATLEYRPQSKSISRSWRSRESMLPAKSSLL